MKICFLTLHWANNYGATLQTYAMHEALKKFGDVSVIDYRSDKPAKGMQLIRAGSSPRDILRAGKDVFRLVPRYRVIKKFRHFTFNFLNLTAHVVDKESLSRIAESHDAVIAGSDQIWNPDVVSDRGDLDDSYFLTFAGDKRRIAFASSMGSFKYGSLLQDKVKSYLDDFHAIAVREKDTAEFLKKISGKEVAHVLDPSLLLSRDEWHKRFPPKTQVENDGYLLVYALHKDSLLKHVVEAAASESGMRVVAVDQDPFINYQADLHVKDAGPIEFLEYFQGASFVVTNSFHGTAFSLNLGKNFVVTTPPTGLNRIVSLLEEVGEVKRLIGESTDKSQLSNVLNTEPDALQVETTLNRLRDEAMDFLENSLLHERNIKVVE